MDNPKNPQQQNPRDDQPEKAPQGGQQGNWDEQQRNRDQGNRPQGDRDQTQQRDRDIDEGGDRKKM
jgi:hypothetical protein